MKTAICPGSFDPVTVGHMDIIKRASGMFDEVVVSVMLNPEKKTEFSLEERIELLKKAVKSECLHNVRVSGFDGLLAVYAGEIKATAVVKGLRAVSDFDYEFQMALTNRELNDKLETVFLITRSEYMYLSSSMVKSVAKFNGDISRFVPKCILKDVEDRLIKGEGVG